MKTILSTLTIALFCVIATSQATDVFAQELKGDATYLRTGANGDDDCYSFKLGDVTHQGEATQQISGTDLMAILGATPVIIANEGCAAPASINPVSMTVTYADGRSMDYPVEQMHLIKETPALAERLLHNAASVTFSDISFSDEAGIVHRLQDKVFNIN